MAVAPADDHRFTVRQSTGANRTQPGATGHNRAQILNYFNRLEPIEP
jgi:hypothetical protein